MLKTTRVEHSTLGAVVELRELSVGQWRAVQKQLKDDDDSAIVLRYMAEMLHIDGVKVGWDALQELGMSEATTLMPLVTAMLSGEQEETPAGEQGNG